MPNKTSNPDLKRVRVVPISRKLAKNVILKRHYMSTYPTGAFVNFGVVLDGDLLGVCVYGYSGKTPEKVKRIWPDAKHKSEYLEMQRLWVHDRLGHNTESFVLSQTIKQLKQAYPVRLIVTHAGGCKNDCGIIYQANSWLFFGSTPCVDFYLTDTGQYRNILPLRRQGKARGITNEELALREFGPGKFLKTRRYTYAFPIDKRLRKELQAKALPYPKTSDRFRYKQEWQS